MSNNTRILDLSHDDAKKFFLKQESYFNFDLPPYFTFDNLLKKLDFEIAGKPLNSISNSTPQNKINYQNNVNYIIFSNKDGKLSWRPLQLIHPVVYVALVDKITEKDNWKKIQQRFVKFQKNEEIECLSIPIQSNSKKTDKAEQVLTWWNKVEQESIALALEYEYLFETDIANCYSSIYTHSIAWSIESKHTAKNNRKRSLLGNFIDGTIQDSQNGQTNGIPQGSVLMDFVAELVLGYVDAILSIKLKKNNITKYKILRYRDDYRIFVNSVHDGELILRLLSEILMPFGLKLNSNKTRSSRDIISSSVKEDKIEALKTLKDENIGLQKQVLLIYQHSLKYSNSGSLVVSLTKINKKISELVYKKIGFSGKKQIISIVANIAFQNPRCIPVCCAIISNLLATFSEPDRSTLASNVFNKMVQMPNAEFAKIWLQRMLKNHISAYSFDETLCNYITDNSISIWNSDWISSNKVNLIMKDELIFNQTIFDGLSTVISNDEFDLFDYQMTNEEIEAAFEAIENNE